MILRIFRGVLCEYVQFHGGALAERFAPVKAAFQHAAVDYMLDSRSAVKNKSHWAYRNEVFSPSAPSDSACGACSVRVGVESAATSSAR